MSMIFRQRLGPGPGVPQGGGISKWGVGGGGGGESSWPKGALSHFVASHC